MLSEKKQNTNHSIWYCSKLGKRGVWQRLFTNSYKRLKEIKTIVSNG